METFFINHYIIKNNLKELNTQIKKLEFFSEQYLLGFKEINEEDKQDRLYVCDTLDTYSSFKFINNIEKIISKINKCVNDLSINYNYEYNEEVEKQVDYSIDLYELNGTKKNNSYNKIDDNSKNNVLFNINEFNEYLVKTEKSLDDLNIEEFNIYVKYLRLIYTYLKISCNNMYNKMHNNYQNIYNDNVKKKQIINNSIKK